MIIGLHGKAGSGKDTVGKIIRYIMFCETGYAGAKFTTEDCVKYLNGYYKKNEHYIDLSNWEIKKFADPLRKIASILLGMDEEYLYRDEFKQMMLPECWNTFRPTAAIVANIKVAMTGREFLQKLGTEAIRNGLHENTWVNALMSQYRCPCNNCRAEECNQMLNWIITDLRFDNEYQAIKQKEGICVKIQRNNIPLLNHSSENQLDNHNFDYIIDNNGSIEDLIENVKIFLTNMKINNYV